jgi:uncharacterized protein
LKQSLSIGAIFIDTGAFVARILRDDQFHEEASKGWLMIQHIQGPIYSSEHILDETATLIARRAGYDIASEWLHRHLKSKLIAWLSTRETDLFEATNLMKKYSDQKISFTDCLSFVLMKREGCKTVFTFDKHFQRAGFNLFSS